MKSRLLRTTSILGLMTGVGLIGLPAGPAHALVVTENCDNTDISCTAFELEYGGDLSQGGSIQVDDKLFSNWHFDASLAISPNLILVTATGEETDAPGLVFSGDFGVLDQTFTIQYDVSLVDDGRENFEDYRIVDSELEMGDFTLDPNDEFPPAFYGGSIVITESSTAFTGDLEVRAEDLVAPAGLEVSNLFDSDDFAAVTSLTVITTIEFDGHGFGNVVELTSFSQTFSQEQIDVPEPSSAALFGVGLAALGGGMWRRRRRKA